MTWWWVLHIIAGAVVIALAIVIYLLIREIITPLDDLDE